MSKEQLLQQLKTIIDAAGENATLIKQEAVDLLELQAQITQTAAQTNGAQPGLTEALAKLKISQSTKIGFKLLNIIDDIAVPKFKQGVIISLSFLKSITFRASVKAEDPELTIKPNFFENNFEIFCSKLLTDLPICVDSFRVFITALISLLSYTFLP